MFSSGKLVVTGTKNKNDAKLACRKFARTLQKLGYTTGMVDFKVQNVVGSCDVGFAIRLEGLAHGHYHVASYEPELFPGLVYRILRPKVVILVFISGKVVFTGAKSDSEVFEAFEMIHPVLKGK